jgi:hypothetical protein
MVKFKLTYEYLYNAYINQNKSTIDIAKETGFSDETIRTRLIDFNIPIRKHSVAQKNHIDKVLRGETERKHPTKGRNRTKDETVKISLSQKSYWERKKLEAYYNE